MRFLTRKPDAGDASAPCLEENRMLVEMTCLVGGVPVGYLLRSRKAVVRATEQSLVWSVRVLLFLLGLNLGGNEELMTNLGSIGVRGVFISLCCLVGTLAGARAIDPLVAACFPGADRETPTRKGEQDEPDESASALAQDRRAKP